MKIHVRRRHIRAGTPRAAHECPIALAFIESARDVPCVDETVINCRENTYALPRSAQRFIRRFDAGKPVKPFAFVLK